MSDDDENHNSIANSFNGKIMIGSIAILFVACFVIVIFHVYRRWCRPGPTHHHNRRRNHLPDIPIAVDFSPRGLDPRVIKSLPTFDYNSKSDESPLECAVCLSEFEENETGRALPECEHCFHVDCIDMWLLSHSDCPLCRSQVKAQPIKDPVEPIENPHEVIICISGPDDAGSGSNSGLQPASQKQ